MWSGEWREKGDLCHPEFCDCLPYGFGSTGPSLQQHQRYKKTDVKASRQVVVAGTNDKTIRILVNE